MKHVVEIKPGDRRLQDHVERIGGQCLIAWQSDPYAYGLPAMRSLVVIERKALHDLRKKLHGLAFRLFETGQRPILWPTMANRGHMADRGQVLPFAIPRS
jgi:hypothetical protein